MNDHAARLARLRQMEMIDRAQEEYERRRLSSVALDVLYYVVQELSFEVYEPLVQSEAAEEYGMSRSSFCRGLKELRESGYVERGKLTQLYKLVPGDTSWYEKNMLLHAPEEVGKRIKKETKKNPAFMRGFAQSSCRTDQLELSHRSTRPLFLV